MVRQISLEGRCLNGNFSRVKIQPANHLILSFHKNGKHFSIPFDIDYFAVENHTIVIGREQKIKVVEHLFSALYGLSVFNVQIDLYGDEIPFYDGSSLEFVRTLKLLSGSAKVESWKVNKKISVQDCDSSISYEPSESRLLIDMKLIHPYIDEQQIVLEITPKDYEEKIAPARTFVFTDKSDPRLKDLPPYGIGITAEKFYSAEPLRFSDEPVRHKVLDLLGDLYILKKRLTGEIRAVNTSHRLNLRFVRELLKNSAIS